MLTGVTLALLLTHSFLVPASAYGQTDPLEDVPHVTATVAFADVRIVQAPGRVIERGTVLMRDGLITAVGTDIDIPYDARLITGDSLVVYAGFIDGLSHAGIPEAKTPDRPSNVNTADPPAEYAGIQPDRSARDLLEAGAESIAKLREAGFTAAHVVPQGRMLPGGGSIILLSGDEPDRMVLRPNVSQFMQFQGAPGVYPATPIGVMAELRQLVRETRRRTAIEQRYAENPAGMQRPTFDPIHEALRPVVAGEKPLFVMADGNDSALEVHRAVSLAEELRLSVALAGLSQAFDVVPALREADVPLFVTLGLPEDQDEESDSAAVADTVKAMTEEPPASFFVSDLRTHSYEDIEAETENLEARRALARDRYIASAATLHEAGLRFGVTTIGVDPEDIRDNVIEMVGAGLPEDAALAALTIDGARHLGLDRILGTIERGKLANLVVTRGSYFDEEGDVRMVVVEGRVYEIEEDEDEEEAAVRGLAGTWRLEIDAPDDVREAVIELTVSRGEIGGRVTSSELMRPADINDAEFDNGRLRFTISTSEYGNVRADLTVTADSMSGTIDVPGTGILNATGTKIPNQ